MRNLYDQLAAILVLCAVPVAIIAFHAMFSLIDFINDSAANAGPCVQAHNNCNCREYYKEQPYNRNR